MYKRQVTEQAAVPAERPRDRKKAAKLAWSLGIFGAHQFYLNHWPQGLGHLWMTYVGGLFCLDRFIGMGNINGIEGESAWIYLAVGCSILIGSAAWAVCDALELRRSSREEARAYAYASQSR